MRNQLRLVFTNLSQLLSSVKKSQVMNLEYVGSTAGNRLVLPLLKHEQEARQKEEESVVSVSLLLPC